MDKGGAAPRPNPQTKGDFPINHHASHFKRGILDGCPIALGYFAVAFTLGIAAKNAGFSALQAMVESLTNNASAGEYAVFSLAAAGAGYIEVAIMTLVANARYLLMSCSLSQKAPPCPTACCWPSTLPTKSSASPSPTPTAWTPGTPTAPWPSPYPAGP